MASDAPPNAGQHVTSKLHVYVANNAQKIQLSDWPKWLVRYDIKSFSAFYQNKVISDGHTNRLSLAT